MQDMDSGCLYTSMRLETASVLVSKALEGIEKGTVQKRNLVWLDLTGCSGNIISLLDGADPGFLSLLSMTLIQYNNTLMAAEGEYAMERLFAAAQGDFILVIEGAVSTKDDGIYNIIGHYRGRMVTALSAARELGEKAAYVLAVGTCASAGGISAAMPNPAGCSSAQNVLSRKVIRLPGCPCHPEWFLGTFAYILLFGEPALDEVNRPLMFYSTLIHDICPRRPDFDRGNFAKKLGGKGCMFKLGCRGPVTRTFCPIIKWNHRVNWPIGANTPCIGCAQLGFPDQMEPFIVYNTT